MTIMSIAPQAGTRQAEVIAGLTAAAAFLGTHPGLPIGNTNPLDCHIFADTDEEARAEVDRVAVILGVTACWTDRNHTHYEAVRHFGGDVTYRVIAISKARMDQWNALMSYGDSVRPEITVAA